MTARTAGPQRFPQDPTARHSHYGPTAYRGGRRPGTQSNRSSILSQAAMTSEELWALEDEIPDLSNPMRKASERPLDTVRRMSFTEEPLNTFGFPSEVIWPTAPLESYVPPPKAKSYTNVAGAGKRRSMLKKSTSRADSIDAAYATPAFVTKDGNSSAHSSTTDLSMGSPIPMNKSSLSRPPSLGYSLDLLSSLAPREGGYALAAQMAYPGSSPVSSMHSEGDRRSIHTSPSFRNSRGPPARSAGMRWNDSDDLIIPPSVRHSTATTISTVSYHEEVVIVTPDSQQSSPQLSAVQSNTPVAPSPLSQHTTAADVRPRNVTPGQQQQNGAPAAGPTAATAAAAVTAAAATTAAVAAAKPKSKKELKAEAKAAALESKRLAEQKAREKAETERRAREEKAKAKADAAKKAKEDKARLKAEKEAAKRASIMPKPKPAPAAATAAVASAATAAANKVRAPNGTAAPAPQQRPQATQLPQAKPAPTAPLPVPPQRAAAAAPSPNGNAQVPPPPTQQAPTQAPKSTIVAVPPTNGSDAPLPVPKGASAPVPAQPNPPVQQRVPALPQKQPSGSIPETLVTPAPSTVSRDGSSVRAPSSTAPSSSPAQRHSVLASTPSQASLKPKTSIFSSIKKRFSMVSMNQVAPIKADRPASVAAKATPPPPTPPPKSAQPSPVRPAALNVPKPVIVPPRGSSLATGPVMDDTPGTESELERHASLSNPSSVVVTPTTSVATNSSPSFFPVRPNPAFRDRSDSVNSSSTDPSFVTPATEGEAPDNRVSKLSLAPSNEAPLPVPVAAVAH
ncbi:hypothetical protein Q8F55_000709 [Vanrija albida]|uniref:Inner centromere protein ARK-binding domain-containing protein n=1 Tax=Vanrija albida TaxID=181172 RepID=A0ABR3QE23_9TREE